MQLAEFETVLQDGVISVPAEYLTVLPEKIKIMVKIELSDIEPVCKRNFKAVRINTKGFKFNRDEANAR
jgi:hypothetical protein